MMTLGALRLARQADALSIRAKLYDIVSTATRNAKLAARIAGECSDVSRWLLAQQLPALVEVSWRDGTMRDRAVVGAMIVVDFIMQRPPGTRQIGRAHV